MCSWYTHVCLFVPNCSLLKSFRIQNWRRGWDPECKQSVHMAVIIGKIWVLLTRGPRNLVIMPIDLRICCGEWHRRWQKSECFSGCYWSRRLQVVEEFVRSRKSECQDVYTVDAAFAETLRTCSHCYCWKTQVLNCVTRRERECIRIRRQTEEIGFKLQLHWISISSPKRQTSFWITFENVNVASCQYITIDELLLRIQRFRMPVMQFNFTMFQGKYSTLQMRSPEALGSLPRKRVWEN